MQLVQRCWQRTGGCTDDCVSARQHGSLANVQRVESRQRGTSPNGQRAVRWNSFFSFRSLLRRGGRQAETPSAPLQVAALLF